MTVPTEKQMGFKPDLNQWISNGENKALPNMEDITLHFFQNRLLKLSNESLYGVNPYDPALSAETKAAIAEECKINVRYFVAIIDLAKRVKKGYGIDLTSSVTELRDKVDAHISSIAPFHFGNFLWSPEIETMSIHRGTSHLAGKVKPRYVHVTGVHYDKPGSKYAKRIGKRQPKRYKLIARGVLYAPTK